MLPKHFRLRGHLQPDPEALSQPLLRIISAEGGRVVHVMLTRQGFKFKPSFSPYTFRNSVREPPECNDETVAHAIEHACRRMLKFLA